MAGLFAALAAAPGQAQTVTISAADCAKLATQVPAPDVAYQPGVDMHGRAVAPADLNASPSIRPPDTISFDVAVDLRRFGIAQSSPLFQPNVPLGRVSVEPNGRVLYNGQPIGNPETAALGELCRRRIQAPR